ncbi:hypothetical protein B5G12_11865 [Faecalibacterium sp. An58]|uniref:hypothetical protein n=1 Tax=Faecalibacterium sp. An58 TaxID=1965648 RepID=UPI000B3A26C9|nr:hypothetical protein [Faecalibacterium sp. An58]OUN69043.1 hypothetical protein B5G12_11865 [Faecalibacterium sp. An58]
MKLKKIASLALAGIMAVSMLAGCSNANNNNDDDQDDTVVVPVDDSLATAVNSELSAKVKNTLPITADANLEAALKAVADKIATADLINNSFITTSDTEDVRHLMGLDKDASLTATANKGYLQPLASKNQYEDTWKYFTDVDSVKTTVDLIVYDGDLTEEGLAHKVAGDLEALINNERMPNDGTVNYGPSGKKTFDYDYTANIVSVKIDDMRGDNSHYLVALKVVQTPTEVVNV